MNLVDRRTPRTMALVAVAIAGALALAIGLRGVTAQAPSVSWSVPTQSSVTINPGDTVTWTWADALPHTVTSLSGPTSFASGQLTGNGQTFSFTFDQAGTYTYQCDVHPGDMTGTVVVQAAGGGDDDDANDDADDDNGAAPTQPPQQAPSTGTGLAPATGTSSSATALTVAGAMLIAVSGGALLVSRRRR